MTASVGPSVGTDFAELMTTAIDHAERITRALVIYGVHEVNGSISSATADVMAAVLRGDK